jgi:pyridoxal/pyridoxine/pyridoxamine kinase
VEFAQGYQYIQQNIPVLLRDTSQSLVCHSYMNKSKENSFTFNEKYTCITIGYWPKTKQGSSMAAQTAQVRHPANTGCILSKYKLYYTVDGNL